MLLKTVSAKGFVFGFLGYSLLIISGCSSTPSQDENYKGVYESKSSAEQSLEVPPDLSSPDSTDAFVIPSLSNTGTSYSDYTSASSGSNSNVLPKSSAGVRFVRDGSLFWLEIDAKAEEIWPQVRGFFMDLGFSFVSESPVNGLLETNWLENRFDVPTGWFSSIFGKLSSTGLMDKYRIRLERSEKENVSLLFITHQGLKEQSYGSWAETDYSIKWQAREPDPELEAEMLQRFLVFRGVTKSQAKNIVSKAKGRDRTRLIKGNDGSNKLEVAEIFPRTWRRISIALDRMGIVIEDRNRSKGIYFIKTTENFVKAHNDDQSWFASKEEQLKVAKYQLSVDDVEDKTIISILNENGEQDKSKTSQFILEKLNVYMR